MCGSDAPASRRSLTIRCTRRRRAWARIRSRHTSTAAATCSARQLGQRASPARGALTITSCAPRAGRPVNRSGLASGCGRSGASGRQRRVEVRHDAHRPARRVGRAAVRAHRVDLGRRAVLVALGERVGRGVDRRRRVGASSPPPGRPARSPATIARRPVSGSTGPRHRAPRAGRGVRGASPSRCARSRPRGRSRPRVLVAGLRVELARVRLGVEHDPRARARPRVSRVGARQQRGRDPLRRRAPASDGQPAQLRGAARRSAAGRSRAPRRPATATRWMPSRSRPSSSSCSGHALLDAEHVVAQLPARPPSPAGRATRRTSVEDGPGHPQRVVSDVLLERADALVGTGMVEHDWPLRS